MVVSQWLQIKTAGNRGARRNEVKRTFTSEDQRLETAEVTARISNKKRPYVTGFLMLASG